MPDPRLEQFLERFRQLDPESVEFQQELERFEAYRAQRLEEMIAEESTTDPPPPEPPSDAFEQAVAAVRNATMQPVIRLRPVRGESTVYDSKLGGVPYLPPGFAYPRSEVAFSKGLPLRLLAQLNFAKLPRLPDFPDKGILQIYIDSFDLYGVNFESLTEQTGFRVVYHEQLVDESLLQSLPDLGLDDEIMPFAGKFRLEAQRTDMPMCWSDSRFDGLFLEELRRHMAADASSVEDLRIEERGRINEVFSGAGHRMGGYAALSREDDPRKPGNLYENHTVLLLQLDSAFRASLDDTINWGDGGTGLFLIEPERLGRRDFSNVLYLTTTG